MNHQSSRRHGFTGPLAVLLVMDHRTSGWHGFTGPLAVLVDMDHRSIRRHGFIGPLAVLVDMDHRSIRRHGFIGPLAILVVWTIGAVGISSPVLWFIFLSNNNKGDFYSAHLSHKVGVQGTLQ